MLEIITIVCLLGAATLLIILSLIDLREGLLPNELVMGFAALGFVFHLSTVFHFLILNDMLLGCFIGGAFLYLIRGIANFYYGEDSLGLGDVKLLSAAGIWLGPAYVLIAMTLGALIGIFHGLYVIAYSRFKADIKMNISQLSLPAGPGFAAGIAIASIIKFQGLPEALIPGLLKLIGL